MKKHRSLVVIFFVFLLSIPGCVQPAGPPQAVRSLSAVPSVRPGEEVTFSWQQPADWGTGSDRCYRVELFSEGEWQGLGTVIEPWFIYEFPVGVTCAGCRFSVRAETSLGYSNWVVTNLFDISFPQSSVLRIEPGDQELENGAGEFNLAARGDFEGTVAWSADVPWLELPEESLVGDDILVRVLANENGEHREGIITASIEEFQATIAVTQAGREDEPRLVLSPKTIPLQDYSSGSFTLSCELKPESVGTRIYWTSDANWLSLPASSLSGAEVRVTLRENTTDKTRTGKITGTSTGAPPVTVSVSQSGRIMPQAPVGLVVPSSLLPGEKYTLIWDVPENWGTGENFRYRVEFFNGTRWALAGVSFDTFIVFTVPDINTGLARFRVRAETSHGYSQYTETAAFSVGDGEVSLPPEGSLAFEDQVFMFAEGKLILLVTLRNRFEVPVDFTSVLVVVKAEEGEVLRRDFIVGIVLAAGTALEQRYEFPLEADPGLEGLWAEFFPSYSFYD